MSNFIFTKRNVKKNLQKPLKVVIIQFQLKII
jgi:hypothetical protein